MATDWKQIFESATNRFKGESQSGKGNKQSAREGEQKLIKALNDMYKEFRDRVLPKPDYDKKYSQTIQMPELPSLKSEKALAEAAGSSVKESLKDKRGTARDRYLSEVEKSNEKAMTAEEAYFAKMEAEELRAKTNQQKAEYSIADRGLQGSSIASDIRRRAESNATDGALRAKDSYQNQTAWLKEHVEIERERLDNALKGFEIAEAAKAEKELKRLQSEQKKAFDKYVTDIEAIKGKQEKLDDRISSNIKKDEEERNNKFLESELTAAQQPYEGDREAEMQNRLSVAEGFYKSLPKKEALGLVVNSSNELKSLLGRYYDELVRRLGG